MSQPNKRSYTTISTTTSTTCTGGAGVGNHNLTYPPAAMQKAKSQAVALSLDGKNGQQQSPHVHFAPDIESAVVDDPNSMIEDPNPNDVVDGSSPAGRVSTSGVTANLSRKKATPPQPAKKLVIKLVKG
ncbi:unnamed protein product [Ilex paraguariensis]|uniref:Uncharacterized protein n=1 Tax=Ilex paraguariensis TaxID=185542 RepID=A0ABC8TJW1_9AQUA